MHENHKKSVYIGMQVLNFLFTGDLSGWREKNLLSFACMTTIKLTAAQVDCKPFCLEGVSGGNNMSHPQELLGEDLASGIEQSKFSFIFYCH